VTKAERGERRELWRRRVEEQKSSGLSVRAFCREQKLTEYSFYWWRRELSASESPLRFALVETATSTLETGPPCETRLELVLGTGERLRIPPDETTLRLVLKVLRGV
jgi:hypothetical protein